MAWPGSKTLNFQLSTLNADADRDWWWARLRAAHVSRFGEASPSQATPGGRAPIHLVAARGKIQ